VEPFTGDDIEITLDQEGQERPQPVDQGDQEMKYEEMPNHGSKLERMQSRESSPGFGEEGAAPAYVRNLFRYK
jgi:hypothetical protein